MHLAVEYNSIACIPLLATRCHQLINQPNIYGITPLIYAVYYKQFPLIQQLIKLGANINQRDQSGSTVLHYALDDDTIRLLCDYGADVNVPTVVNIKYTHWGYTPLHCAALRGNLECVKTLIDRGANIRKKACDGMDAARVAYEYANMHIVDYLEQFKLPQTNTKKGHRRWKTL